MTLQGRDYESLPDEDDDCKFNQLNDDDDYKSTASRLTIRSPRTEAVLKNVEQALRKTDKVI